MVGLKKVAARETTVRGALGVAQECGGMQHGGMPDWGKNGSHVDKG